MMTKERSTKIVTFMTPGAGVQFARAWPFKSYSDNALFLFKTPSLLPGINQTNYVYRNDDQGSTKIVNFMTPRAGFLMLGVAIIHYSQYVLSSTLSIYSTLIAIV